MNAADDQIVAEAILAELLRQAEENHPMVAPWVDEFRDLNSANIDGRVNLVELAHAAITAYNSIR